MTTVTAAPPAQTEIDDRRARTTLWHVIRSEWTKFWSVRSTFWTLLILVLTVVGIGVLASWGVSTNFDKASPADRAQMDVTFLSMAGITLGQLAIAVLGALTVTSEYSTGGIRTTLTAVPNRLRMLLAKAIVFSIVSIVIGTITAFGVFFACMPFWTGHGVEAHLSDPGVLRAVLGGGLYILASGLFGFAIGIVIRHSAGAITAAVALLLVVPPLTNLLPGHWGDTVTKYFTSNAGRNIMTVVPLPEQTSPWIGYLTITIWWAVPLLIGAVMMKRRDA